MAYIGRGTENISNVEVLDNLTFNGSASYTLQKSSTNFVPSSANNLLISISGVVQQGNFSVSGSTITFDTTVSASDTCDWILHYGTGLITTVADGAITEAKLGSNAVTTAKINNGAITSAKLDSGLALGKIGQVIQATRNTNVTNTSSSLVDGISATITPTSTSSKILLLLNFQWSANATADGIGGRFVRNIPSTDTVIITDANDGGTSYYFAYDAGTSGLYNRVSFSYLDSPSSTSAITYKYQFVPYSGSGSCTFSQTGPGANSTTSFILQEVLA